MNWSTKHKLYIFGLQGIGPLILNGGINGVIAWLIYSTTTDPLSLWRMPMPLAGDLFVTTMIQGILTWICVGILVRNDLRRNNISSIEINNTDNMKCIYFARNLKQYPITYPLQKDNIHKIAINTIYYCRLAIYLFVIPSFVILAIIHFIDNDVDQKLSYMDMVVAKTLYGGIMGLIMTPIAAICALSVEPTNKLNVNADLPQINASEC